MYKVFYNDRTVFFAENELHISNRQNSEVIFLKDICQIHDVISHFLNDNSFSELYIIHKDIETVFEKYKQNYVLIEAAGGLVKTPDNRFLFIFRRGKWDLPKGKLDKGENPEEAAYREVQEECGISGMEIGKLIEITYHTYEHKEKNVLKPTYWYSMLYTGEETLKPQTEEDITDIQWIKPESIHTIIENTYPSITDVLKKAGILQ